MSWPAAQDMATRARLALADTGGAYANALVTLDPAEAAGALGSGEPAVVVMPPDSEFPTWTMTEYTWQLVVISPAPEVLDAWPVLSDLIDELREPLELDRAQLTMWQPPTGSPWPCALLTTTTTTID